MREQRKKLPRVVTLEEMGLVEVDDDVVRLTSAGHEFAALRASVREDIMVASVIRQPKEESAA